MRSLPRTRGWQSDLLHSKLHKPLDTKRGDIIDNTQMLLAQLLVRQSSGKQDRDEIGGLVDAIGDSIYEVSKAIDKIRDASLIPRMELRTVSVLELWRQAIVMVGGKISAENVHPVIGFIVRRDWGFVAELLLRRH